MANSINIKMAFEDTDEKRTMIFDKLPDSALDVDVIKARIQAINASLAAGTSGGLNNFFLSSEGDPFVRITSAYTVSTEETPVQIPAS